MQKLMRRFPTLVSIPPNWPDVSLPDLTENALKLHDLIIAALRRDTESIVVVKQMKSWLSRHLARTLHLIGTLDSNLVAAFDGELFEYYHLKTDVNAKPATIVTHCTHFLKFLSEAKILLEKHDASSEWATIFSVSSLELAHYETIVSCISFSRYN